MKKIPDNAPDLIRWVNYIIHTKPINTIAGVVLSALGVGVSAGGIYLIKYSLSDNSEDIEPPVKESEKPKPSTPTDKKPEQNDNTNKS